jgi:2'-5' RNA ligase
MRLFLAILPSRQLRDSLTAARSTLRGRELPPPENLHLTLVFVGETDREADVRAAMESVPGGPFRLTLGRCGSFGDVLWAGVEENPRLNALAEALREALRQRGFLLHSRPFLPHITLARHLTAPDCPAPAPASMIVRRISLMRSDLSGGSPVYTEIASKRL